MSLLITSQNVKRCDKHTTVYGTFSRSVSYLQITDCVECRRMLRTLVQRDKSNRFNSNNEDHFDSDLFSVMQDFSDLQNH